jgi:hypothetical protein
VSALYIRIGPKVAALGFGASTGSIDAGEGLAAPLDSNASSGVLADAYLLVSGSKK